MDLLMHSHSHFFSKCSSSGKKNEKERQNDRKKAENSKKKKKKKKKKRKKREVGRKGRNKTTPWVKHSQKKIFFDRQREDAGGGGRGGVFLKRWDVLHSKAHSKMEAAESEREAEAVMLVPPTALDWHRSHLLCKCSEGKLFLQINSLWATT